MRMRKVLLAMALALTVAAVFAGTSAASHQEGGGGGPNDFAVGSVTTKFADPGPNAGFSPQKFRFSAHSGPAGEDPKGYVVGSLPTGPSESIEFQGHVTCLFVQTFQNPGGSDDAAFASIEAQLDEPIHSGTSVFTYIRIVAFDFATQGNDAQKDQVFVDPFVDAPSGPPDCGFSGFKRDGEDHGNVTIHDATP